MFTGIVEELGEVVEVDELSDSRRLTIAARDVLDGTRVGDSIAVDGCCLTVTSLDRDRWTTDVMKETLDKTSLGGVSAGDRVNLERAVTAEKRLGGHIVQGHVDGVGTVLTRTPSEHWDVVEISIPRHLTKYVVDKGSITIDGISLTVVAVGEEGLTVSLIPETLSRTTLGARAPGDTVNLEVDILAKHLEKLATAHIKEQSR